MPSFVPLRYSLPKTSLSVRANIRFVVVVDEDGGHLAPEVGLSLAPHVVPDREAACSATLDPAVLESGSLAVELAPNGLIASIGTAVTRSSAAWGREGGTAGPVFASVASLPIVQTSARLNPVDPSTWTASGALRTAFGKGHPRTAALIADLSARAEQFLAGLRMSDQATEVLAFGSALEVVERELAAADRMRREWIAAQGFDVRNGSWELDISSLVPLEWDGRDAPPAELAGGTQIPVALSALADDFGVLLAVLDPRGPNASGAASGSGAAGGSGIEGALDRHDEILIRRTRHVNLAVYRRVPRGVVGHDSQAPWRLDEDLTGGFDVVDAASVVDVLSPDGAVFGGRAVHLAFHPDGSLRIFGVTSGAGALGSEVGAAPFGVPAHSGESGVALADVAAAALEAARLQLDLLHVADEFTKLAATHAHRGELASLEQDARFAALRSGRRG